MEKDHEKETIIEDRMIKMKIWDFSGGQYVKKSLGSYFKIGDCCMLVYNIRDEESFESIDSWMSALLYLPCFQGHQNFPFVLVGNMSDVGDRKVSYKI